MLCDAHNHLHDIRLDPYRGEFLRSASTLRVRAAMVNGTRPEDWEAVSRLAAEHSWLRPSFGLHPWHAPGRSAGWLRDLEQRLERHPGAGVGEIGLDRWIEGADLEDQKKVFTAQLRLAAEQNRPATVHCIKAWGALWEIMSVHPLPACGFLLHAYGGPLEMTAGWIERGAYFSFSPSFLHPRKERQREIFRSLPAERLLVETDAPDLRPPDERNLHPISSPTGEPLNHPANLEVAYEGLAEVRGIPREELEPLVARNFAALFGTAGS